MQDAAIGIIRELTSTPHGQTRLIGAIFSFGTAFGAGWGIEVHPALLVATFLSGIFLILISIWMAVIKAKADADERRANARPDMPTSDRSLEFCRLITKPLEQHEIAQIPYTEDDNLSAEDAIKKLKILRAQIGAWDGEVLYWDAGRYIPRVNDQTIIKQS